MQNHIPPRKFGIKIHPFAKIFHEEFGLYPKEFALRNRSKTGKVDSASEIFSKNEPETQK